MALTKIPAITREFFRVPVVLTLDGTPLDPTLLAVEFAIVLTGVTPITSDWHPGEWEVLSDDTFLARVFVGDSTTTVPLTQGSTYDAWIRITDNPERPTRLVGQIIGT